jgi:hypothetical protein
MNATRIRISDESYYIQCSEISARHVVSRALGLNFTHCCPCFPPGRRASGHRPASSRRRGVTHWSTATCVRTGDLSSNAQWRVPTSRAPQSAVTSRSLLARIIHTGCFLLQLITAGTTATYCGVNLSVQRGPCRHCVTCRGMRCHTRGRTRHGAHRALAVPLLVSVFFMPCAAADQRGGSHPSAVLVVATTTYEQQQHYGQNCPYEHY